MGTQKNLDFHKNLANYFANKPLYVDESTQEKPNTRKLVEQPWQQVKGECWTALTRTLCDLGFVEAKCSAAMTDNLLADYHEAITYLSGDEHIGVSAFRKFTQNNASYLRNHAEWCLQLAIIEPPGSPVGKEARLIALSSSIPCFEPIHQGSSATTSYEMRFSEHTKPIQILAFNNDKGLLLSSEGEELISWDTASGAIASRYKLPNQEAASHDAYYGRGTLKIAIATQAASMVVVNMLADVNSGQEISTFVNQRTIDGEWMAPPAISPDSSVFAICTRKKRKFNESGADHTVTVVASESGTAVSVLPHTGVVSHAVFSPDSHLLVTTQDRPEFDQGGAGGNNMLRIWDISTNDLIHEQACYGVRYASFSPDGKRLLAQSNHDIYGWDTSDWTQLFKINDVSETKYGVAFVDNTTVLTWSTNSVTLWNTLTLQNEGRLLFGYTRKRIHTLILSADRQTFAIGYGDGLIELWSIEAIRKSYSPEELYHTDNEVKIAHQMLFSPNSKQLAVSYFTDLIGIVDVESKAEIISRKLFEEKENQEAYQPKDYQSNKIESIHYTPDCKSLILMLLSSKPDKKSPSTPFGYKSLSFGSVRRISATDLTDQAVFEYKDFFQFESSITPDGYCVFVKFDRDNLIQLRGDDLSVIKEHRKDFRLHWLFSPDGGKLVYTNTIWSFAKNTVVYSSPEPAPFFNNPVFSPDGSLVALSKGNKINLVSITHKTEIISLDHSYRTDMHIGERSKNNLLFSPDGRRLLVIDAQTISVIDTRTGRYTIFEKSNPQNPEISCRFSPDSHLVFGVEKDYINVWNADTGKLTALLPLKSIDAFDWNPDGTLLGVAQGGSLGFYQLLNIGGGVPYITPTYIFQFNPKSNQPDLTAACPHCGHRFEVPSSIPEIIANINSEYKIEANNSPCLKLPDKAWDEPGLLSSCPNCMNKIRFNPFIAGNENHKPKWKFW